MGVNDVMTTMTSEKNYSLFKEERKEKFLEGIKEGTRVSYERIFKVTEPFEKALDKDLAEFTLEEMETVLHSFKANNRNTIESYGRIISSYLNWCVENNLIKENILKAFRPDDFERYLKDEEAYIPYNKLARHEDRCQNPQDAVIIRLLFEGVGGKQLSEIRNLKEKDVDEKTNMLHLVNTLKAKKDGTPEEFTERWIHVEDRTIKVIKEAIDQKTYVKRNGFMVERDNVRKHTDLIDNEYVVRPSLTKTGTNWNTPVDKFVIYRRMQVLTETLGVDMTAKFIQRSGMVYQAHTMIEDEEELSLNKLKMIADKFNMTSYHNLKGFLTVENVRKTYPLQDKKGMSTS